ncbi:MAG: hypothetical protein Q9205_004768 [Flavoplaca limonia]
MAGPRPMKATVSTVVEEYYGFNSLQTGLLLIPAVLPMLVIGPVAGWTTDRQGSRITAIGGFGLLGPLLSYYERCIPEVLMKF